LSNTEDPAARPHHPDDLLETRPQIGHHGEDEVQENRIEARVGHVQPVGVPLPHVHPGSRPRGTPSKDPKHPGRHISRDHLDARGKVDQVLSGPVPAPTTRTCSPGPRAKRSIALLREPPKPTIRS